MCLDGLSPSVSQAQQPPPTKTLAGSQHPQPQLASGQGRQRLVLIPDHTLHREQARYRRIRISFGGRGSFESTNRTESLMEKDADSALSVASQDLKPARFTVRRSGIPRCG